MVDNNYIDLIQREEKVNFSITNYLTETKLPVITGNYKNSYLDVQTTTHEIGHAFQKYCASRKDQEYIVSPLLKYPTMEIAEMFSYSMELIMMDHVSDLFEEEDYKKYCFLKINNLVANLPYICLVDEFQEMLYSKEDLKKIKEPFFTTKIGGTGLGTSLSTEIIDAHDGTLEFESKEGEYTLVTIKLPLEGVK